MKPKIHPKYYPDAKIICACGNTYTTGSTSPELKVDICSQCHPFYTGEQRIVDTAGQVDRFMKRLERTADTVDTIRSQQELQKRAEEAAKKLGGEAPAPAPAPAAPKP